MTLPEDIAVVEYFVAHPDDLKLLEELDALRVKLSRDASALQRRVYAYRQLWYGSGEDDLPIRPHRTKHVRSKRAKGEIT